MERQFTREMDDSQGDPSVEKLERRSRAKRERKKRRDKEERKEELERLANEQYQEHICSR